MTTTIHSLLAALLWGTVEVVALARSRWVLMRLGRHRAADAGRGA